MALYIYSVGSDQALVATDTRYVGNCISASIRIRSCAHAPGLMFELADSRNYRAAKYMHVCGHWGDYNDLIGCEFRVS